jgi:hypothetical protein
MQLWIKTCRKTLQESMSIKQYILILLVLAGFVLQAQTREDYDVQGTRQDPAKTVQIYPNPATDFVHIRFEQFSAHNLKLTVHNIIGNPVKVETEIIDAHEIRIHVKDLVSGYYLLAVKDDEDKFQGTYKFLKR